MAIYSPFRAAPGRNGKLHNYQTRSLCKLHIDLFLKICYNNITVKERKADIMSKRKNPSLSDLIGAELVRISGKEIVVKKNGKEYTYIVDEAGSYSDWWETFGIMDKGAGRNPVITNYQITDNGETYRLVFFGLNKKIAELQSKFHNDSDWDYGCFVNLYCKQTGDSITIFS